MRSLFLGISLSIALGCSSSRAQDSLTDAEWKYRSSNSVAYHQSYRNLHVKTTIFATNPGFAILVLKNRDNLAFIGEDNQPGSCLVEFDASENTLKSLNAYESTVVHTANPLPTELLGILRNALEISRSKGGCYVRVFLCGGTYAAAVLFGAPEDGWQQAVLLTGPTRIEVRRLRIAERAKDSQDVGLCEVIGAKPSLARIVGFDRAVMIAAGSKRFIAWRKEPRMCLIRGVICSREKIAERLRGLPLSDRIANASDEDVDSLLIGETGYAPAKDDIAGYSLCELATTGCGP